MRTVSIQDTERAALFELWKGATMPMATVGRVFDITPMVRYSQRTGKKLNMLLCHAIGMAAKDIPQFYRVVEGDTFALYDQLAIQVIVMCRDNAIHFCDIPFTDDRDAFEADYLALTRQTVSQCTNILRPDLAQIDTSALVSTELDTACNQYAGHNNVFICWGRYRRDWRRRCHVQIFLQFHHVQMDGSHVATFLNRLQEQIEGVKRVKGLKG